MTECERLINEGTLPSAFLEPEMRECYVPVEMKKLWALQIDLIQQVKKIADRHNLTFFAMFGTAIGAVRHNGFIPWDDDIDIAFKRDEYNAFLKYAQEELEEPYFLQIPTTDKYFYRPFASLRNSNATCIAKGDQASKCNNGAIIHIFPLDGYKDDKRVKRYMKIEGYRNNMAIRRVCKLRGKDFWKQLVYNITTPFLLWENNEKHYLKHEAFCTEISKNKPELIGVQYTHFSKNYPRLMWDKCYFDSAVMVPFEYFEIPVPVGNHEILTKVYGDYMQLPPEKDRINKHTWEMELDTPYKQYCSEKYGVVYDK